MVIERRIVVPHGGWMPTEVEWFDTETGRVVPKPEEQIAHVERKTHAQVPNKKKSKAK